MYGEDPKAGVSRIPEGPIRKALMPMIAKLKEDLVKSYPQPEHIDVDKLVESVVAAVKQGVVVKHETVNNQTDHHIVESIEMPEELTELLTVLTKHALIKSETPAPAISLADYRPHDQDGDHGSAEYYGFAAVSGAWYIICFEGGSERYSAGSSGYADAWKNRLKLSYGIISEAFEDGTI